MENFIKHKMRGKNPIVIVGIVLFGIVAISALAILFGYIIMSLWNWLMPELFDLPIITYWQAVGLFILAKILFGFGGGSGSSSKKSKHGGSNKCRNRKKKRDFSKWAHYDKFWEEKGESAYQEFVKELSESKPNVIIQTESENGNQ
ncbi:MAG: hypothetical protein ACPGD5_01390 [Salibacteraceae bacterium]